MILSNLQHIIKQQTEFPTVLNNVANYTILLWLKRSFRWQLLVLISKGGVGWTAQEWCDRATTGGSPTLPELPYHQPTYPPYTPLCGQPARPGGCSGERCNIQPGWDFQPRGTLGPGNSEPRDDWIVPPPQAIETMPCSLLNQGESILVEMSGPLPLIGALWGP